MNRPDFTAEAVLPLFPRLALVSLSEGEAAAGVRAALERGALAAVSQLGRANGFLGNPQVKIDLPGALDDVARMLRFTGWGRRLDELVTAINRAAESAVPLAKPLFMRTVKAMSVEDALKLVRGGASSVTEFFAAKTRSPLSEEFLPIVTQTTGRLSLARNYNELADRAASPGLLKPDEAQVETYVTRRALEGLFWMVGEEERKIRANPFKTGSAILRHVFGV